MLTYINNIFDDLTDKYPEISDLTHNDKDWYEKKRMGGISNADGWFYPIRHSFGVGHQGLGYKYEKSENNAVISCFNSQKHKIITFYWIRPIGESICEEIHEISKYIKKKYKLPVSVIKLEKKQTEYFLKHSWKNNKRVKAMRSFFPYQSNYPETIIDTKITVEYFYKKNSGTDFLDRMTFEEITNKDSNNEVINFINNFTKIHLFKNERIFPYINLIMNNELYKKNHFIYLIRKNLKIALICNMYILNNGYAGVSMSIADRKSISSKEKDYIVKKLCEEALKYNVNYLGEKKAIT